MSSVCFVNGNILSDKGAFFEEKNVLCKDGVIVEITDRDVRPDADIYIDIEGKFLTPGFTDAHTHGRVGFDFNTADAGGIARMLESYLSRGVTSLFPTLASATFDELLEKGDLINKFKSVKAGMARVLGIHLEGRYLNPEKKGAHAESLLTAPDADDISQIFEHLKTPLHVSAAYELDKDETFILGLIGGGATVGLAHTSADYATAHTLYEKYRISLTHMFNAMPPLHHRSGGAVCAGLCDDMFTELICDGIHVSPEMVRLAYKCKGAEKLVLITDSMEATDSPDGEYSIAGQPVIVKDSIARTLDGALAGSTLNLESAVNNLCSFARADIASAVMCATANPCKMLGVYGRYGSITSGKAADFIVADCEGEKAFKIDTVYLSVGSEEECTVKGGSK